MLHRPILFTIFGASLASCVPLTAQAPTADPGRDPALQALIWTQHAAERRALCRLVFNAARTVLNDARNDPTWTAALEQSGMKDMDSLPTAIIVDVDETVLDNSPHQVRLCATGAAFDAEKTWGPWVREKQASPLPGAVEFLTQAAQLGVTIYYVTNRDHELEPETRANLARLGFPLQDDGDTDVVLTLHERESFGSDKTTRRAFVAQSHRILMLFGDDLGDFMSGVRPDPATSRAAAEIRGAHGKALEQERSDRVDDFADWFGTRWFVLPNVMYGSWLDVTKLQANAIPSPEPGTPSIDFAPLLLRKPLAGK